MFEYDLFVSYSHIDDRALTSDQAGWITSLHQALEVRVAQLAGRDVKIWRDPRLQGNEDFADEIVDRFSSVAAFLCVVTPRYLNSEWCQRELGGFSQAAERTGGLRLGNRSRIFKVTKTQVPHEQHPEAIQRLLGYDFFTVDPDTKRPQELGPAVGGERERQYWSKLDDLAYDITQVLEAIAQGGGGAGTAVVDSAGERESTVYLAETTSDLKEDRESLRRDLVQQGYTVLPQERLPLVASELEEAVTGMLAGCALSVHPIGASYGLVPEGATGSIVELQHDLAVATSGREGLERLLWIPPNAPVEDERQAQLLTALRSGLGAESGADTLEVGLEEFKAAMYRRLEASKKASEEEPALDSVGEAAHIYLICDRRDVDETLALEDHLFERGFEVTKPLFADAEAGVDESDLREDHEENLKHCEAVMIYYGRAHEVWLRAKLRELKKIAGYGRSAPMLAKAIFVAEPASPAKERLRTHEALVLRATEQFTPEVLNPFLEALSA